MRSQEMPDLPRERASNDEVVDRLVRLVGEEESGVVLESSPNQSVASPAAIQVGQPMEELDVIGRPAAI